MRNSAYETVHTITDWYDGARTGVANFQGRPHYYQCKVDYGPDKEYLLTPLDDKTFQYSMENLAIFQRWENAFNEGITPIETHPALPEEQVQHLAISVIVADYLLDNQTFQFEAEATFLYGPNTVVRWEKTH